MVDALRSTTHSTNLLDVVASTTQTQGQAPLVADNNVIITVANANDVVTLQKVSLASQQLIINLGANVLQVFPASGDDLGNGVNASTTVPTGDTLELFGITETEWTILQKAAAGGAPSFFTQSHNTTTVSTGTNFMMVDGGNSGEATEINRQNVVPSACTLKRMSVQVSSQRNGISVMTLRINGVNGNESISVPASTTGFFQDLVNTDVLSNGDLLAYQFVRGGGSGSWTIVATAVEIVN